MARDARRTKSVTFTPEQTDWIEAQVAAGVPDHGTVIKSAIDRAMSGGGTPAPKAAAMATDPAVVPAQAPNCSCDPKLQRDTAWTLDFLLKKFMAAHPGRELSDSETADFESRWDSILVLRSSEGE